MDTEAEVHLNIKDGFEESNSDPLGRVPQKVKWGWLGHYGNSYIPLTSECNSRSCAILTRYL